MKKLTLFFFLLVLLINSGLQAQNWGSFGPVVSELDSIKRVDYQNNLIILQNIGSLNALPFGNEMDSLFNYSNGSNPLNGFDTLIPPSSTIRNGVLSYLDIKNFSIMDSTQVIRQYDSLYLFGTTRSDTIENLFNVYGNDLNGINELPTNYGGVPNATWSASEDSLRNNQLQSFGVNPGTGVKNFKNLFDNLFDKRKFTRLELFGGMQNSFARYYGFTYENKLPVAGIRSSEQFDRLWEPRYRAQVSWFSKDKNVTSNEGITTTLKKNTPFMFNGNFDMMFNPILINASVVGQLRLISVLGIDGATYAPAHKERVNNGVNNNVGYTTGWGPCIGAGLSLKKTNVVIYGLSTISYGNVVCGPNYVKSDYIYTSTRIEAGIRFLNNISFRFENGLSNNWAVLGRKNVRYTQATVGLPTTGLFRR
jgi:hypothetical protein